MYVIAWQQWRLLICYLWWKKKKLGDTWTVLRNEGNGIVPPWERNKKHGRHGKSAQKRPATWPVNSCVHEKLSQGWLFSRPTTATLTRNRSDIGTTPRVWRDATCRHARDFLRAPKLINCVRDIFHPDQLKYLSFGSTRDAAPNGIRVVSQGH